MRSFLFCIILFVTVTTFAEAQSNLEPINAGSANFLVIPSDARILGMGGSGVALINNNNAVFYNGASVLFENHNANGIAYSYSSWMSNHKSHSLHSVGGYHLINNKQAIYGGFRYYDYPKVQIFSNGESNANTIHPHEWSIDLGYSRNIIDNLFLSTTIKFINSSMGHFNSQKNAKAVAFDLGAFYGNKLSITEGAKWMIGLNLSDLGSKLKYLHKKEYLPLRGKIGAAVYLPFHPDHELTITSDLIYRMSPSDVQSMSISSGFEYTFINHFILRGGYHHGDKYKADWPYATIGIGVAYSRVHFDFSWLLAENKSLIHNSFNTSCYLNF